MPLLSADFQFVDQVAYYVEGFEQKRMGTNPLYNMRCPICGDSDKKAHKKRGYIFYNNVDGADHLQYKCFNCDHSEPLKFFLRSLDGRLFKEYCVIEFKDGKKTNSSRRETSPKPEPSAIDLLEAETPSPAVKSDVNKTQLLSELGDTHAANKYFNKRLLPPKFKAVLSHSANFRDTVFSYDPVLADRVGTEPRLIIPFHDRAGNLTAFQGRAYDDKLIRYITVKVKDDLNSKVFGTNLVNFDEEIRVLEGPFDSMFIHNAVATADSSLTAFKGGVYIWDNQPRNVEIIKQMSKAIKAGHTIIIWENCPFDGKDVNEMVENGADLDQLELYINTSKHRGLAAQMRLAKWSKIKGI